MVTRLPKTLPAFLLLMAIMLPVQAQQPPTAAQEELPVVFETVDVQVINIDVVVTDRKGNPITGLTLDDFEIYEDGTLQKLTNFYEVRGRKALQTGAPETEPRTEPEAAPAHLSRKIVFFIDNVSLAPFNRNRVFRAMKKFAASAMGPDDEAMIATWNRSMTIRVPFTSNVDQILRSLDEIAGESAYGISRESDRRTVRQQIKDAQGYGEAVVLARQYAQSVEHDLRTTVSGLKGLMQTTAGIEGKKVFVVTTEGLEMQPGADMFYYVEDVGRQQWGNSAGAGMLEGMAFQNAYLLQSIAHEANANGITLYTIHAGGLVGMSSTSADQQEAVSFQVQQAALSNSTESLRMLAEMTGGIATVGTNNFAGGFERLEQDLESYYSLGYRSGTQRVDRRRAIEVRTRNRSYQVRHRRSFVEKSIDSEMADRVMANLFHQNDRNDLGIFFTHSAGRDLGDGTFQVPIEIHIPVRNLTIFPHDDIHRGSFSIWVMAADPRGDMSEVQKQDHTVTFTSEQMEQMKNREYIYAVTLILRGGRNTVSIGVLDQLSKQTGFKRQDLLAMSR